MNAKAAAAVIVQLWLEAGGCYRIWNFALIWSGKFNFYQGKVREFWKLMSVATMYWPYVSQILGQLI